MSIRGTMRSFGFDLAYRARTEKGLDPKIRSLFKVSSVLISLEKPSKLAAKVDIAEKLLPDYKAADNIMKLMDPNVVEADSVRAQTNIQCSKQMISAIMASQESILFHALTNYGKGSEDRSSQDAESNELYYDRRTVDIKVHIKSQIINNNPTQDVNQAIRKDMWSILKQSLVWHLRYWNWEAKEKSKHGATVERATLDQYMHVLKNADPILYKAAFKAEAEQEDAMVALIASEKAKAGIGTKKTKENGHSNGVKSPKDKAEQPAKNISGISSEQVHSLFKILLSTWAVRLTSGQRDMLDEVRSAIAHKKAPALKFALQGLMHEESGDKVAERKVQEITQKLLKMVEDHDQRSIAIPWEVLASAVKKGEERAKRI
jgi:hypothetical protein